MRNICIATRSWIVMMAGAMVVVHGPHNPVKATPRADLDRHRRQSQSPMCQANSTG